MHTTKDTQKQILKFIQQKIETDEMWAEAFTKLITLDEPDQNGAIWDLLESANDSIRWDELFAKNPEKSQAIADAALQSMKERDAKKAQHRGQIEVPETTRESRTAHPNKEETPILITQDTKKQILKFIQNKIETDEMWAEAFTKLITLDEPDQNGAAWRMLESIEDSIRWDKSFAEHPEVIDLLIEKSRKSMDEREKKKAERRAKNSVKAG